MNTPKSIIKTDDNLMELALHGNSAFPFKTYFENITDFDFNCIDWHWHTELEFIIIETGSIHFDIGENHFELTAGNGIFINSKILHRMYSEKDSIIPNFLCLPSFISPMGSIIYEKYVLPILNSSIDYLIFSNTQIKDQEILKIMSEIINLNSSEHINELAISSAMQRLWLAIYENTEIPNAKNLQRASDLARLQIMMQFIHENYRKNISLKEIADVSNVSKSTALNLFNNILYTSPVNYLISYRLKEAALLLLNTEKKIGAISDETGFNNVDYFCKTFKKFYSQTPSEYRKEKRS